VSADRLLPQVLSGEVPVEFAQMHHVIVSNGGADPRAASIDRFRADAFATSELSDGSVPANVNPALLYSPVTAVDETLPLVSERAIVDSLSTDEVLAFIGRPRVYVVSMGPTAARPDGVYLSVDLNSEVMLFI
jgi:hypothetical protein